MNDLMTMLHLHCIPVALQLVGALILLSLIGKTKTAVLKAVLSNKKGLILNSEKKIQALPEADVSEALKNQYLNRIAGVFLVVGYLGAIVVSAPSGWVDMFVVAGVTLLLCLVVNLTVSKLAKRNAPKNKEIKDEDIEEGTVAFYIVEDK